MELGKVICTEEGPSPSEFSFVVTTGERMPVRQGQYVELETEEGEVIAFVTNVIKTNRYFMRADSVKEYEKGGRALASIFPADRWEYIIAQARVLGVQGEDSLQRATFPPSPGQAVYEADPTTLSRFLGLNSDGGVEIGKLRHHEVPVKLDLTKLLRKHVAILSLSGGGKSHTSSVIIEELLSRSVEKGRIAAIVIDVHGEYVGFAEPYKGMDYSGRVAVVKGQDLRIGVPNLSSRQLKEFVPDMSDIQTRELQRALDEMRAEMRVGKGPFGLDEVIARVERDERIHKQLQQALLGWLHDLRSLGIFDRADYPSWEGMVSPGRAVIIDLSDITSLRKKQVLVAYLARRLFNSRKRARMPPFVLCLEEAHQFCVGGDSLLLLPQGVITIKELVEREHVNGKISQGQIESAISPSNHCVLSLGSDLKVHHFPVKQYFKLTVPRRLRISLENGMVLTTTPETLLMSVNENGIKWIPASEVRRGSYLGTINSVEVEEKQTFIPDLLPNEAMVYLNRTSAHEVLDSLDPPHKRELGRKYYSWKKNCCVKLEIIRKLVKERGIPLEEVMSSAHEIKMGSNDGTKIPSYINEKFLYFLGLMASDGHLSKCTRGKWISYEVGFSNTNLALITLYRALLKELFGINAKIRSRVRSKARSRIYRVTFGSKLLFHLLHRLGVHAGRSDEDDIPSEIMCAPKESVRGFIRGLFDGDGWANDKARQVGICNKSKVFLEKLRLLLLRFGVSSSIGENRDGNYELRVSGEDMKEFCVKINFNHPKKKMIADKLAESGSDFSFDSIPYPSCMKKLRRKIGLSAREFGICSGRESGHFNTTRSTLLKLIQKLEPQDDPEIAKELAIVEQIVKSNIRWCKVGEIEKLGRGEVYDLTVSEGHNFIANGLVVHNCPSSESKGAAISRSIIETIAREGRKFYASLILISQRPVRLSTTVLSQANTNIILRITNPYDLEHIKQSSEAITGEVADMISSLPVGEALIVGEAVNHPIFVKIRRRRSKESAHGMSLEEAAKEFEKQNVRAREDAKAFM